MAVFMQYTSPCNFSILPATEVQCNVRRYHLNCSWCPRDFASQTDFFRLRQHVHRFNPIPFLLSLDIPFLCQLRLSSICHARHIKSFSKYCVFSTVYDNRCVKLYSCEASNHCNKTPRKQHNIINLHHHHHVRERREREKKKKTVIYHHYSILLQAFPYVSPFVSIC